MSSRSAVKRVKRAGTTRLVIDFFFLNKHGKRERYRRNAHVQTVIGARAEAQRLMDLAARTGSPEGSIRVVMTFETFVAEVYRPVFLPQLRPGTRERYEGILRQGVMDHFGPMTLDAIGFTEVLEYTAKLRKRRRARPLKGKTRGIDPRGHGNLIRAVIRAAVNAKELPLMPVLPSFPESPKLPAAPSERHVDVLLDNAPGWLRLTVALYALAGLRQGEVRALQIGDIDFNEAHIWVRRAYSADEVVPPKSGLERVVPMLPELAEILREAVAGKPRRALVVCDDEGLPLPRQRMLSRLKAFQKKTGLSDWGCHSLRHYFCSQLTRKGASIEAVRTLAGHGSVRTTQRYLHVTRGDLHDAVAKLEGRTGNMLVTP